MIGDWWPIVKCKDLTLLQGHKAIRECRLWSIDKDLTILKGDEAMREFNDYLVLLPL